MTCPGCDQHHDDHGEYCNDCKLDLRHMLETCHPEIVGVVVEWFNERLQISERPESIECPKCMTEFHI